MNKSDAKILMALDGKTLNGYQIAGETGLSYGHTYSTLRVLESIGAIQSSKEQGTTMYQIKNPEFLQKSRKGN